MNPTTYETSDRRRHATRRTWLAASGAAAALLVVLALVVAAYQARTDRTDPLAGAAGTPSAASPAPTASPEADQAEGTDEAGEDTGQTGTGGNQSGGNQSGEDGEDSEADDGEDGEGDDGEDVPPAIDVSAKAAATVAPATHHAINCDPTNITVHGTITLTGGLWLPGPPPTKVTVEYRWILDGEPGLAQAVHFTSPGEQDVSTSMSLTGNATAAIEILGPNQSTSPDAAIHLFCS